MPSWYSSVGFCPAHSAALDAASRVIREYPALRLRDELALFEAASKFSEATRRKSGSEGTGTGTRRPQPRPIRSGWLSTKLIRLLGTQSQTLTQRAHTLRRRECADYAAFLQRLVAVDAEVSPSLGEALETWKSALEDLHFHPTGCGAPAGDTKNTAAA